MTTTQVQIGWMDYLAVAARRRWFFLVPFVLSILIGVCVAVFSPRIYEAQALIAVQNERLINPIIQGLAVATSVGERLNTLREEILSWSNLTRLIKMHHLDKDLPSNKPVALEHLVRDLREDIQVKMRGGSLIEVNYQGRDPEKVQQLVNSLTDIVIQRDAAIQQEQANTAVNFIQAELDVYRKKLEESERKLREFKEIYMTQMPVATALNDQLKALELQLSHLLIDDTEEHPRVIEVKRRIEEVRRRRDQEIQRLVAKGIVVDEKSLPQSQEQVQAAYEALVAGLESPEVTDSGTEVAIKSDGTTIKLNDAKAATLTLAPREQQELTRLMRDYSVNESIYKGLLEKLERAKITGRLGEDKEGGKFEVIERARFPLRPIKPNLLIVFLVACLGGVALGASAVVLAEYFDQSFQTAEEVAVGLDLAVLGSIPMIVTETDVDARRQRVKSWMSLRTPWERVKTHVITPIWNRVDQALLRWGL